jgi:hypothetical protein
MMMTTNEYEVTVSGFRNGMNVTETMTVVANDRMDAQFIAEDLSGLEHPVTESIEINRYVMNDDYFGFYNTMSADLDDEELF